MSYQPQIFLHEHLEVDFDCRLAHARNDTRFRAPHQHRRPRTPPPPPPAPPGSLDLAGHDDRGDPDRPPSLLLAPLLESLPDLSPTMTTAAEGDPPFSLLLRLLDLPDLLQAEAGAYFTSPLFRST
jgi:hypothetical protein